MNDIKDRREHIATAVLAGLMANEKLSSDTPATLAQISLISADALIAALDAPRETKLYEDGVDYERKTGTDSVHNAPCRWPAPDDETDVWTADCGLVWCFDTGGTPEDHNMTYCPKCGREIEVQTESEESK
jgi:hypothetical protein